MVFGQVFERFIEESPVSVMVRGLMEKFLSPQKLDQLFEPIFRTLNCHIIRLAKVTEESINYSIKCERGIRVNSSLLSINKSN